MGQYQKLTAQIFGSRRTSSLPFNLEAGIMDSVAKEVRKEDKELLKNYNKEVQKWNRETTNQIRLSAWKMLNKSYSLMASLKGRVGYDNEHGREANRVGWLFRREGIWIQKGARRGHGGIIGGSWKDSQGRLKFRNPMSAGKMDTGKSRAIEWFDTPVSKRVDQLADIVGEYSADLQVDATKLLIKK